MQSPSDRSGRTLPTSGDRPRLSLRADHLEKTLANCHVVTNEIELAIDRLVGSVPQDCSKAEAERTPDSLDRKLDSLASTAESLLSRLQSAASRLNGAV